MVVGILGAVGFGITYWVEQQHPVARRHPRDRDARARLRGHRLGQIPHAPGTLRRGASRVPLDGSRTRRDDRSGRRAGRIGRAAAQDALRAVRRPARLLSGWSCIFPLRSLGPKPGNTLFETNWKKGLKLVTVDGRQLKVDDLEVGGVLTVFPQGFDRSSPDQVILHPVVQPSSSRSSRRGGTDWGVAGYVAYSKMCTHLGCPVGLYQHETEQLVCPCHQSIFNVLAGAIPEFGPAPRPLPQLPITADLDGYLRAKDGFDQAVGPGFWERP